MPDIFNEDEAKFIADYAKKNGVHDSNVTDIESVREVNVSLKETTDSKTVVVKFASIRARNRFTDAKHFAIRKRLAMQDEAKRICPSNTAKVNELNAKITEIKKVKISEDIIRPRVKLLRYVREQSGVKVAYTRDAVIHAVTNSGKVRIYSALDLHPIGVQHIPLGNLGLPQSILDIHV